MIMILTIFKKKLRDLVVRFGKLKSTSSLKKTKRMLRTVMNLEIEIVKVMKVREVNPNPRRKSKKRSSK